MARKIELEHQQRHDVEAPTRPAEPATIAHAVSAYISVKRDIEKRDEQTVYKYEVLLEKQLLRRADELGCDYLVDLTGDYLEKFVSRWLRVSSPMLRGNPTVRRGGQPPGVLTQKSSGSERSTIPWALKKKQERLSGFFNYCVMRGWIDKNPVKGLSRIDAAKPPTLYFPPDEFDKIIDSTYLYDRKAVEKTEMINNASRLRVMILLLRWSGLALGDAISLERTGLTDDYNLFLYRQKTAVPVYVPSTLRRRCPSQYSSGREAQPQIFLLEWQWRAAQLGEDLAACIPASLRDR